MVLFEERERKGSYFQIQIFIFHKLSFNILLIHRLLFCSKLEIQFRFLKTCSHFTVIFESDKKNKDIMIDLLMNELDHSLYSKLQGEFLINIQYFFVNCLFSCDSCSYNIVFISFCETIVFT